MRSADSPRESARRLVHLAMGGLAFLLRELTAAQAAGAAAAAVLFNLVVLPRLAPALFRRGERQRPWRSGIVVYPASVRLLIVLFPRRLEIVANTRERISFGVSAEARRVYDEQVIPFWQIGRAHV